MFGGGRARWIGTFCEGKGGTVGVLVVGCGARRSVRLWMWDMSMGVEVWRCISSESEERT